MEFPSIQSFFGREVVKPKIESEPSTESPDKQEHVNQESFQDGFTSSEINEVLDPSTIDSNLSRAYEPCPIMLLQPGARHYEIGGRIVNFSKNARKRQNPEESEGFWYLTVSDGTGMIGVNLHCRNQHDYQPLLGQHVTIWASFIGFSVGGEFHQTSYSTSVYPGRASTTHITFHNPTEHADLYRKPLDMREELASELPGLMTLQAFLTSGYEYEDGKILVCVRSVGLRRTVMSKVREVPFKLVEVGVFDHTTGTMLTLWGDQAPSAASWVPNRTLLLITAPKYNHAKDDGRQPARLSLQSKTVVEVDPTFERARWLRSMIKRKREKEAFFIHFPTQEWQDLLGTKGTDRVLYTIAEMEERIMSDESASFTGKLNVLVFETNLLEHWRLGTICCTECCGIPLCGHTTWVTCKNCGEARRLYMNPRALKTFIDESGCLAGSKLVWSDHAWKQLLLPDDEPDEQGDEGSVAEEWQQILQLTRKELKEYEESLLYSRVTLSFGWSVSIHRLCILGVEW